MQTIGLRDIPDPLLWKRDMYLRRLEPLLDSIELVSLDVFDTLLLRCAARPDEVFERAAAIADERGLLRRPTAPAEYRVMRTAAERLARERQLRAGAGSDEVTLEQIYEQFPASLGDRDALLRTELEAEREACFINPNVASLIRYCRGRNIRIALLSDMYLSSDQFAALLTAGGLEAGLTDAVLVSSEAGCGKRSGELFDVLLRRFPDLIPERIAHIGDNETADVLGAAKRGIAAIHYAVVPDTIDSPFHWEAVRHGILLPELAAIRKLAGSTLLSEAGEGEPFYYQFGAGMLGPFVQGFCDWALDLCVSENRNEIHPLMREAHLLGPALEKAARIRGLQVSVKPLYVSRQATLLASMRDYTERELEQVAGLGHITFGEAAGMLGIDACELPDPLQRCLRLSVSEARDSGESLYDAFKRFMLQEPAAERARATIARQRKLLLRYIRQTCDCPDKLLTVDLGFNGTIQSALDAAYAEEGADGGAIHLLAVGSGRTAEKLLQGTDIRCWIEAGGEHDEIAKRFARSPGLIEELMMGEFGSTVRYELSADGGEEGAEETRCTTDNENGAGETGGEAGKGETDAEAGTSEPDDAACKCGGEQAGAGGRRGADRRLEPLPEDGRVFPVLAPLAIPAEQFRFKRACQEGVFAFQSYYEHWRRAKPQLTRKPDAREWCGVLHRVLDMPTPQEAAALGDLVHQDNFGGVQTIRLCEPIPVDWQSRGGDYLIDLSAFGPKTANVFWPQGLVTRHQPYLLYKSFLRLRDSFGSAVLAFHLMERLTNEGISAARLYGTGQFARQLVREALLHRIRIDRVIDPGTAERQDARSGGPSGDLPAGSLSNPMGGPLSDRTSDSSSGRPDDPLGHPSSRSPDEAKGGEGPPLLPEAIVFSDAAEHIYIIGTLTDIDEYRQSILRSYERLRPDIIPRVFEPFA